MKPFARAHSRQLFLIILLLASALSLSRAADPTPALTIRKSDVYLYSQQDSRSPSLATLQKDEPLTLVAEAVGPQTWYMVRTRQGLIGWVQASDVTLSETAKKVFTEENLSISTWSAQAGDGTPYQGTWSVQPQASSKATAGTWTLQDASGKTVLRGTWSAEKFSTGWNGVWRAQGERSKVEYTGSWSADLTHGSESRLGNLFEAAARNAVRGVWTGGRQSGTWSIRAAS
jgi:Bacterial SH3 domain